VACHGLALPSSFSSSWSSASTPSHRRHVHPPFVLVLVLLLLLLLRLHPTSKAAAPSIKRGQTAPEITTFK
jgi:hypothetical protein